MQDQHRSAESTLDNDQAEKSQAQKRRRNSLEPTRIQDRNYGRELEAHFQSIEEKLIADYEQRIEQIVEHRWQTVEQRYEQRIQQMIAQKFQQRFESKLAAIEKEVKASNFNGLLSHGNDQSSKHIEDLHPVRTNQVKGQDR